MAKKKIKTIRLVDLLKLNICQDCPSSFKKKNKRGLRCEWDLEKNIDVPCLKVPSCGNWPDYFSNEVFEQIKIPCDFN